MMSWETIKETSIKLLKFCFWAVVVIGGLLVLLGGNDNASTSSSSSYVDDLDYEQPEPDFEDYKQFINADSVEACSSSGCYNVDADVSDGVVNRIDFNNGGYRDLDADVESDGSAYGTGSSGDDWEIHISNSDIENAKEKYMEDYADSRAEEEQEQFDGYP